MSLQLHVLPNTRYDDKLKKSFIDQLSLHVELNWKVSSTVSPPLIVIFRPQGRPNDEFNGVVLRFLGKCDLSCRDVILITAFATSQRFTPDCVSRFKHIDSLLVTSGHLDTTVNKSTFKRLGDVLGKDYGFKRKSDDQPQLRRVVESVHLCEGIDIETKKNHCYTRDAKSQEFTDNSNGNDANSQEDKGDSTGSHANSLRDKEDSTGSHAKSGVEKGNSTGSNVNSLEDKEDSTGSHATSLEDEDDYTGSHANSQVDKGNSTGSHANSQVDKGNSTGSHANNQVDEANSTGSHANSQEDRGNSTSSHANIQVDKGNSTGSHANSQVDKGNSTGSHAHNQVDKGNSTGSHANSQVDKWDSTGSHANSHVDKGSSTGSHANSLVDKGSSTGSHATSLEDKDDYTGSHANSQVDKGNSTGSHANGKVDKGNSTGSHVDTGSKCNLYLHEIQMLRSIQEGIDKETAVLQGNVLPPGKLLRILDEVLQSLDQEQESAVVSEMQGKSQPLLGDDMASKIENQLRMDKGSLNKIIQALLKSYVEKTNKQCTHDHKGNSMCSDVKRQEDKGNSSGSDAKSQGDNITGVTVRHHGGDEPAVSHDHTPNTSRTDVPPMGAERQESGSKTCSPLHSGPRCDQKLDLLRTIREEMKTKSTDLQRAVEKKCKLPPGILPDVLDEVLKCQQNQAPKAAGLSETRGRSPPLLGDDMASRIENKLVLKTGSLHESIDAVLKFSPKKKWWQFWNSDDAST